MSRPWIGHYAHDFDQHQLEQEMFREQERLEQERLERQQYEQQLQEQAQRQAEEEAYWHHVFEAFSRALYVAFEPHEWEREPDFVGERVH